MKIKILFITHETTRTGAPMVLLHFIKWLLIHHPEIRLDVVALRGGDLEPEFQKYCTLYINYRSATKNKPLPLFKRILKKLKVYSPIPKAVQINRQFIQNDYTLIYANSVVSVPFAVRLKQQGARGKLLAHIHELNTVIKQNVPDFEDCIPHIDALIAVSESVASNLRTNWGILQDKLNKVYECAEVDHLNLEEKPANTGFIVGASGTVNWRKGYDVFIQVAGSIHRNYPQAEIEFVWVGRIPQGLQFAIEEDLKKLNIVDQVTFTGEIESPALIYNSFDVFLMTSREDPFPLVCIEVGMMGKPIICFEGAAGTEEIIKNGGGKVVPYLDVNAMGEQVLNYYNHPEAVKTDGEFNKQAFSKFTPGLICPQYFEVIQKVL